MTKLLGLPQKRCLPAGLQNVTIHGRYEFMKQTAHLNMDIIIRGLIEMPMDRAIAMVS